MNLDVMLYVHNELVYDANITHNLNTMADKAGIYYHLWRPEEINIKFASELIKPLEKGLKKLKSKPEYFEKYNASNGWGYRDMMIIEGKNPTEIDASDWVTYDNVQLGICTESFGKYCTGK